MVRKSYIRDLDLERWDRERILNFVRRRNAVPWWSEENGLVFTPRILGRRGRKLAQQILQVNSKADVELLKLELYGKTPWQSCRDSQ